MSLHSCCHHLVYDARQSGSRSREKLGACLRCIRLGHIILDVGLSCRLQAYDNRLVLRQCLSCYRYRRRNFKGDIEAAIEALVCTPEVPTIGEER